MCIFEQHHVPGENGLQQSCLSSCTCRSLCTQHPSSWESSWAQLMSHRCQVWSDSSSLPEWQAAQHLTAQRNTGMQQVACWMRADIQLTQLTVCSSRRGSWATGTELLLSGLRVTSHSCLCRYTEDQVSSCREQHRNRGGNNKLVKLCDY